MNTNSSCSFQFSSHHRICQEIATTHQRKFTEEDRKEGLIYQDTG